MKHLKLFANSLTIIATVYFLIGLGAVYAKNEPFADLLAQVAFFYVAIAAFNKVVLGIPTLWHRLLDI